MATPDQEEQMTGNREQDTTPDDDYMPSTAEVREGFSILMEEHTGTPIEKFEAAFDRWHSSAIRQAKAESLRDASQDVPAVPNVDAWLRARADEIEAEA